MTKDEWQNTIESLESASYLKPFPVPLSYDNPYCIGKDKLYTDLEHHHSMLDSASTPDVIKINILYDTLKRLENETYVYRRDTQSQFNSIIAKLTKLQIENDELKKNVAELVQSRYFD